MEHCNRLAEMTSEPRKFARKRQFIVMYGLFYIILMQLSTISALCPNNCSKRGKCTNENVCVCEELYRVAPDCSQSERIL